MTIIVREIVRNTYKTVRKRTDLWRKQSTSTIKQEELCEFE